MSILRIEHNKENPYVILNKRILEDCDLSWTAKGLWSYLMSRPDNWNVSVSHLKTIFKGKGGGEKAIYSILNELIKAGYCVRNTFRHPNGLYAKMEYVITEFKNFLPSSLEGDPVKCDPVERATNNKGILTCNEEQQQMPAAPIVVPSNIQEEKPQDPLQSQKIELLSPYGFSTNILKEILFFSLDHLSQAIEAYDQQAKSKTMSKGALVEAIRKGWKPNITKEDVKKQQEKKRNDIQKIASKNKKDARELLGNFEVNFSETYAFMIKEDLIELRYPKGFSRLSFYEENCIDQLKQYIEDYLT